MSLAATALVVCLVAWVIGVASRSGSGRLLPPGEERPCPQCGTGNAPFAQFCRRCGRRVGQ